ncbi:MAG: Gfo/Idh/MocA family protein [Enterocloster sp.]
MKELRMAVIGYGGMGSQYVKMISNGEIEGMKLAGVCCRNEAGQGELARLYPGVSVYKNAEDALAHGSEFDAAVIVTPHTSHVEIGKAMAKAGKHILVDKPAGVASKEVKELLEEVERAGICCGMIFNYRMNPVFAKAKELLDQGRLGKLQRALWICNTWYRTPAYHHSAPWRSTWKGEGGGLLINQSQHYLDIWQWLLGMPDSVLAVLDYGKYSSLEVDDGADLQFFYDNGLHGTFISATGENPGVNRLEIWGTKGRLCIEDISRILLDENEMDTREFAEKNSEVYGKLKHHLSEIPVETAAATGYQMVFRNFADHLLKGTPLMADIHDGLRTVVMTNGAYLSDWLGKRVNYPADDELYVQMLEKKRQQN